MKQMLRIHKFNEVALYVSKSWPRIFEFFSKFHFIITEYNSSPLFLLVNIKYIYITIKITIVVKLLILIIIALCSILLD